MLPITQFTSSVSISLALELPAPPGFISLKNSTPDTPSKSVIKKNLSKTNHKAILFFVKKHQKFIQIIPQTIVVFNNFSQQFRIMDG